jgi:hypothetical protein
MLLGNSTTPGPEGWYQRAGSAGCRETHSSGLSEVAPSSSLCYLGRIRSGGGARK